MRPKFFTTTCLAMLGSTLSVGCASVSPETDLSPSASGTVAVLGRTDTPEYVARRRNNFILAVEGKWERIPLMRDAGDSLADGIVQGMSASRSAAFVRSEADTAGQAARLLAQGEFDTVIVAGLTEAEGQSGNTSAHDIKVRARVTIYRVGSNSTVTEEKVYVATRDSVFDLAEDYRQGRHGPLLDHIRRAGLTIAKRL